MITYIVLQPHHSKLGFLKIIFETGEYLHESG